MPPCRPCFVLCLTLGLLMSGSSSAQQLTQGSDYATAWELGNPANWTSTKIDVATHGSTVTYYLNPCEFVTYVDNEGRRRSCMPRLVCDKLEDMGEMLELALGVWQDLATDALTLTYGGIHGGECPGLAVNCLSDIWDDDGDWVVTRTYTVPGNLDPQLCPDAATPAQTGGGCLRHYDDDPLDHTSRSVRECDVVLSADRWDNAEGALNCDQHYDRETECVLTWRIELAHELAHGLGFAHSYLTRRTVDPLVDDFAGMSPSLTLMRGRSSAMSYDRIGSIDLGANGLGLYDQAQYLYNYATDPDPLEEHFAAFGTVVIDTVDNDCDDGVDEAEELFGAAVFALEEDPLDSTKLEPVHMSLTGIHPLAPGQFRMDHLRRGRFYRLLVADARNDNQVLMHGWDFADMEGNTPEVGVARTDVWSEENSGNAYKFSMVPFFATGFDFKLEVRFQGPGSGDHDAEEICVEFP